MGGRGAGSGLDPYKGRDGKMFRYGEEFKTLWQDGNVKYVSLRDPAQALRVPQETRTPGRIYALIGKKGDVKSICHYDNEGKIDLQIDLDVPHNRIRPHAHDGYRHSEGRPVTKAEQQESDWITTRWEKHNE